MAQNEKDLNSYINTFNSMISTNTTKFSIEKIMSLLSVVSVVVLV
jgi:hypothetical protein